MLLEDIDRRLEDIMMLFQQNLKEKKTLDL